MHFINKNLNNNDLSSSNFFFFDNSNGKSHSYDLSMNEIVGFKKLSKFAGLNEKTIAKKFNDLKNQFLLLNSAYKSYEDYCEKHKELGDSFEITKSFLKFLNSQSLRGEKNFSEFKKFLNYELSFERKMGIESIDKNGFYFLEKVKDSYIVVGADLERANIYSLRVRGSTCKITWEDFHEVASEHDNFNEMIDALTEKTGCNFISNIINPDEIDNPEEIGIFALKKFKYIDNLSLIELDINSVLSQEDYSKLIFESYGKSFNQFLKDHLRISGKDIYNKKTITEQQKLQKINLINLTPRDINALETERMDYANLSEDVFECLIQDYDHNLPLSDKFKNQEKDLFHYLEDEGFIFFERFKEKQSFKIRKFYNYTYSNSSKSLEKFFVICSINEKTYNDSFSKYKMNQNSIDSSNDIFSESLFNLGQKHSSTLHDVNVFFNGTAHKFLFENKAYEGLHYNISITEFVKTSMDDKEFLVPGIEMLITDNVQLNDDNFYNYYFQFNNVSTFIQHGYNVTSLQSYILFDINKANNIANLENNLNTNHAQFSLTFSKKEIFTKDLAHKGEYYLIGKSEPEVHELFEYYIMDYRPEQSSGPIGILNLVSSVKRDKIYQLIGDAYKKNIKFNDALNKLKEYPKKYLAGFAEQKDLKRFLESISNHNLISEHGYKITPIDFFGIPTDKNFYKKTVLYLNELDHSFYEADLFTPYGNIEGNANYNVLNPIISTHKDKIFQAFDKKTGLPFFSNGSHLNEVYYYIESKSNIKSLGTIASIKSNEQYQELNYIFRGKGYEEFNDRYFDNTQSRPIHALLINNTTGFPVIKPSRLNELDEFDLYHVLASEQEFIEILAYQAGFMDEALRDFFTKPTEQIFNKDVYLKYKGVYYDYSFNHLHPQKKIIQTILYGIQEATGYNGILYNPIYDTMSNYVYFHRLEKSTIPENIFKNTMLLNKDHGISDKYYTEILITSEGNNSIKEYIEKSIKYWFPHVKQGTHTIENLGYPFEKYKKENVYYYDSETKRLFHITKEYTIEAHYTGVTGSGYQTQSYESLIMQFRNFVDLDNCEKNGSRGGAVYGVSEELNPKRPEIQNSICYTHKKKGTVKDFIK